MVGAQRLPALARGAEELREYVETVRLRLDAFDLAHGVRTTVPESACEFTRNPIRIYMYLFRSVLIDSDRIPPQIDHLVKMLSLPELVVVGKSPT